MFLACFIAIAVAAITEKVDGLHLALGILITQVPVALTDPTSNNT